MAGRLYLLPNLLGHVVPETVLPARTLETARGLRHFLVENAKPARQFLKSIGMPIPLRDLWLREVGAAAGSEGMAALLQPAVSGTDMGVLSDAGCPGVADPGAAIVAAAHAAAIDVIPLVGPSAILLALMASGLSGQHFTFHGYLPIATEARRARLQALDQTVQHDGSTQIFIETPYRNQALLAAILETCREGTRLVVAVDLTTTEERIVSRPVGRWRREPALVLGKRPAMFLLGR